MKINHLVDYAMLRGEPTSFERDYLARVNRIAYAFLALHVPALLVVARLTGAQLWQAVVFPLVVLVGPTLALFAFRSPRAISMVLGVAGMCMAGVLVHLGQGPMQIEMHFHFFVLLALEVVFANPAVILASAATVALHHVALFVLLPASVFNYRATAWAVAVHATFVVIEAIAACYVARTLFDRAIGLEEIVEERTRALSDRNASLRRVLDNVQEGLLTVDRDGVVSNERSAILGRWFGPIEPGTLFRDVLARVDENAAGWFEVGLPVLFEAEMPIELTLAQLPKRMRRGDATWELGYHAITKEGRPSSLLVVITDVTSELERRRAEQERRELAEVLERAMRDREGIVEALAQAQELVDRVLAEIEPLELRRAIHTLKGNSGMLGISTVAEACHAVETACADRGEGPNEADRAELAAVWARFRARIDPFLDARAAAVVTLTEDELASFVGAATGGASRAELVRTVADWTREPAERRFQRVADQIARVAHRVGKPRPVVHIDGAGVRFPRGTWAPIWSALVHAVANAIDHGIEDPEERERNGKPAAGRVELAARVELDHVEISLSDDGRGVDWDRVRERAIEAGLAHATPGDLARALFADGFSTRDTASETSGRGVGLAALRRACSALGGTVALESVRGVGTTLRVRLPRDEEAALLRRIVRRAESLRPSMWPPRLQ